MQYTITSSLQIGFVYQLLLVTKCHQNCKKNNILTLFLPGTSCKYTTEISLALSHTSADWYAYLVQEGAHNNVRKRLHLDKESSSELLPRQCFNLSFVNTAKISKIALSGDRGGEVSLFLYIVKDSKSFREKVSVCPPASTFKACHV